MRPLTGFFLAIIMIGACPIVHSTPDIEVNGVLVDDKGGTALINGTSVAIGESVDGVKLLKVTNEGVVFESDGQEFFQPVGNPNPYSSAKKASPLPKKMVISQSSLSSIKKNVTKSLALPSPGASTSTPNKMPTSILVDSVAVNETLKKVDEIKAIVAQRSKMTDDVMNDMKTGR